MPSSVQSAPHPHFISGSSSFSTKRHARWALCSASVGTWIEYYDSSLFSVFFPLMIPFFIPGETPYEALTRGYWMFALTALARPAGAWFFGHLGDKHGRRPALLSSLYGISLATLCIGFMPSYAYIGVAGMWLITLCKAVQVFCFAGEQNGGAVYVLEHVRHWGAGFTGAILSVMTWVGSLVAALLGVLLTTPGMPTWSWRLAFIAGGVLALLGVWGRRILQESPVLQARQAIYGKQSEPLSGLLKQYPWELCAGFWLGGFSTTPCTAVFIFINPVLMTKGFFTVHGLMWVQSILTVVAIVFLLLAGWVSDKTSPRSLLFSAGIGLFAIAYPALAWVDGGTWWQIMLVSALIVAVNEWGQGPAHAYLKSLFPVEYRYRACSLSFASGMAFFGALTPLCSRFLLETTGQFASIALWLMLIGLGLTVSVWLAGAPRYEHDLHPSGA